MMVDPGHAGFFASFAVAEEPVTLFCVIGKHAGGIPASRDDDSFQTVHAACLLKNVFCFSIRGLR